MRTLDWPQLNPPPLTWRGLSEVVLNELNDALHVLSLPWASSKTVNNHCTIHGNRYGFLNIWDAHLDMRYKPRPFMSDNALQLLIEVK